MDFCHLIYSYRQHTHAQQAGTHTRLRKNPIRGIQKDPLIQHMRQTHTQVKTHPY